jgi:hypothetical protein
MVFLAFFAAAPPSAPPLYQRIDQEIAAASKTFRPSPRSSDAEFLRRVYLDFIGRIPSTTEARTFLNEDSSNKRQRLIDRLLALPEHARHLATVFEVFLMERRPGKHVPPEQFHEFLRASFAANKPYDQLVREILAADGTPEKNRAAAGFYLGRDAEPHVVTRDVGRMFLGMNLQCAQCHDHPLYHSYKQDHYYGIFAFYNRTQLKNDPARKMAVLTEKADGEVSYSSVFNPKLTKTTGPRLPDRPAVEEPKKDPKAPAFSRRARISEQVVHPDNARFQRNAVNRLWASLIGRGLIHPLDLDHDENPPSHPRLLALLADDFTAHKFDVLYFLRELALSDTYQRSSELPAGVKEVPPSNFAVAELRPLTPEQMAWSFMQATGLVDAERLALGKGASEAALYAKLVGNVAPFVRTFGGQPGQPQNDGFEATIDQTLFLKNGKVLRSWLVPQPGNLTHRLLALKDAGEIAEELYVSVLTRLPGAEERQEVAEYLARRPAERQAALEELVWALATSAEFRFNH